MQPYLRLAAAEGRRRYVAGCFEVFVNPDRSGPGSSYAIPFEGAQPTADDVDALVETFAVRERLPRLEYLPSTAPAAEAVLLGRGFEVELRTTVMTCTSESLTVPEPPAGLTFEALTEQSTLADVNTLERLQTEAFGDVFEPRTEPPLWLGHFIATMARIDDEPAGGGMSLTIAHGTTELVGIATAQPFRGRGVAGAVTAELAGRAFGHGALTVFLTPGGEEATRVYARAGFAATDTMLHLRRPA